MPQNAAFTAAELAEILAGTWHGEPAAEGSWEISTDSRAKLAGKCFLPLRGERFDGHEFLAQAVAAGAAVLCCEFTQEEFMDNCDISGSEYPLMRYVKDGIANEIRFRDASVGDYHQTVYSVSIELLQSGSAVEQVLDEAAQEEGNDDPVIPSTDADSDEAQAYAEAEELLASGDKAHAAMAFYALGDYSDARERSFSLWWEITQGQDVISTGEGHTVALREDGTVLGTGVRNFCEVSD